MNGFSAAFVAAALVAEAFGIVAYPRLPSTRIDGTTAVHMHMHMHH